MNWGDIPAWVACGLALAAAVISGIALKHSSESARAAKQSADAADRSALAAERSAAADEAALAETRRESQERRDAAAEAQRPRPKLQVDHVGGVLYLLRNTGTGPAVNLTTVEAGQPGQCRNLPQGVTLDAGGGHEFNILTSMGMSVPASIYVTWDGQATPVALPVPQ